MTVKPLRFVFGVHLHQPVGNVETVFTEHARDVYRPLVGQIRRRGIRPMLFHMSGPLLEWLEAHDVPLLDEIGALVADGALELLLSGMYEPVLAALPREDRVEQIARHRAALRARFGAAGDGLWLTERVWEPDLAGDLADAGVKYVLVDDRHLLVTGFSREQLGVPWRTEHGGRGVGILLLDERLRRLIPSRPAEEIESYFRALHQAGQPLTIFCDDGEKFGGWPQTREWVYGKGWFDKYCDMLERLQGDGTLRLVSGAQALSEVPGGGVAYLPNASYREMEIWTLPTEAVLRFRQLERDLGPERLGGPDTALVRGAHWKNFFVKYVESSRLHKKSLALSALCRARGNPPDARTAVLRSQCNDALWHGVFGGLYLPHLRQPLWRQLAIAERELRRDEPLAVERLDLDHDGAEEIWIHSQHLSVVLAPARGATMVEFMNFAAEVNHLDVLTRRLEPYHVQAAGAAGPAHAGVRTIHEREAALVAPERPPVDLDPRAVGLARLIGADVTEAAMADARYEPLRSWAQTRFDADVSGTPSCYSVRCSAPDLTVEWQFRPDRIVEATYTWKAADMPAGARMAIECSVTHGLDVRAPGALAVWRHPIETLGKNERGLERLKQGDAVCVLFDAAAGRGAIAFQCP